MRAVVGCLVAGMALGLVVACAPAPPPPITPPPAVDAEPWPDLAWTGEVVMARPAGMRDEHVAGIAASDDTVVAVGLASGDGEDVGQAWWSGLDGVMTRGQGPFDGVSLESVAAGPGGFVALGTRGGDPWTGGVTRLALFRSEDGRLWQAALDGAAAPDGYSIGIAGGPDGYLVTGYTDPEPGSIVLTSPDGTTWTRVEATIDGQPGGIGRPEVDGEDWIAPGGGEAEGRPLSILRSSDGVTWTSEPLEPGDTNGQYVDRVIRGPGGYLAGGLAGDDCGPGGSCGGQGITWWSADGATWGRQQGVDAAIPVSPWAVHPERGFLAVTGTSGRSSLDGWAWEPIGGAGRDDIGVEDLVVIGDRIVGGGTTYLEDGTTRASFLVGIPD